MKDLPNQTKKKPKKFKKSKRRITPQITSVSNSISSVKKSKIDFKAVSSSLRTLYSKFLIKITKVDQYPHLEIGVLVFYIINILLLIAIHRLLILSEKNTILTSGNDIYAMSYPRVSTALPSYITAKSYIVYDVAARVSVVAKNEDLRFSPASAAKIMTALVALEYFSLQDVVDTTGAQNVEGSKMGIYIGERLSIKSLLYGLMLPSGNDAAYVLANNFPGGYTAFVERMNQKAKEYRLTNTKFVDPSGYDDNNFTTARELAYLATMALREEDLRDIIKTKSILIYDQSQKFSHQLANLNKLLDVEGVNGIKTGYTDEAGGVLVTSYLHNNKSYIVVVLKSEDRFVDSEKLIKHIIHNITYTPF